MTDNKKTVEEVIKERKAKEESEELKKLRLFKKNIMSGIVFNLDISPDLLEILETWETKDL